MGRLKVDLLTGERTYALDLAQLPFRSRLGAADGTMEVVSDRNGRPCAVRVALTTPKRFLVNELDRISNEATWQVPVDEVRAAPTREFVVDLLLRPDLLPEIETLNVDDPNLEVAVGWYPVLVDDRHYTIENIRANEEPR